MVFLIWLTLTAQAQPSLDWSDWASLQEQAPSEPLPSLDEVQQRLLRRSSPRWLRLRAQVLAAEAAEQAVLEWSSATATTWRTDGSAATLDLALDAAAEAAQACRRDPCRADSYALLGEIAARRDDRDRALVALEMATSAAPRRVPSRGWIRLGEMRADTGDWEGAAEAYGVVAGRHDTWERYAAYRLAWSVVQSGDPERGAQDLAALAGVDDVVGDAVRREVVPLAARFERLEQALRLVETLCPDGGSCLEQVDRALAVALEQQGRSAEADRLLDLRLRGL